MRALLLSSIALTLLSACSEEPILPQPPFDPLSNLDVAWSPDGISPGDTLQLKLISRGGLRDDNIVWWSDGGDWVDRRGFEATWAAPTLTGNYALRIFVTHDGATGILERVLPVGTDFGRLFVDSDPPGAEIVIDGLATGHSTPFTFHRQPSGSRVVSLRFPDRVPEPRRSIALVSPEKPAAVAFDLVPFGRLLVRTFYKGTTIPLPNCHVTSAGLEAWTDSAGTAEFDTLDLGLYRVKVTCFDFSIFERWIEVGEGSVTLDFSAWNIAMENWLWGRVLDSRGFVIPDAEVVLMNPDGSPSLRRTGTDSEGYYSFPVPPGVRRFVAEAPPYFSQETEELDLTSRLRFDWNLQAAELPPPEGITLIPFDKDATLVLWSPVEAPTAESIEVFRRGPADGQDQDIALVPAARDSFLDQGLAPGTVYRYTLRTWNIDDAPGLKSLYRFIVTPLPMQPTWDFLTERSDPSGIAVVNGEIWVADAWSSNFYVRTSDYRTTLIDTVHAPTGFYRGLHFDGQDFWTVRTFSSGSSGVIEKMRIEGRSLVVVAQGTSPTPNPTGIVSDGTHLWTCDSKTETLYKHSLESPFVLVDKIASPGSSPHGLAWDGERLWSCDSGSNRIYRHAADPSTVEETFMAPAAQPRGLSFDAGGHLWTATWADSRVYRHSRP